MADFFFFSAGVASWLVAGAAIAVIVVLWKATTAAKRAAEDIKEKSESLRKFRNSAAVTGLELLEKAIRGSKGGDKTSE